jgi:peptidoglycan-associated lipoprotein
MLPIIAGCKGMQSPDKTSTLTPSGTFGPRYNPNGDSPSGFTTPSEPGNGIGGTSTNEPPGHGDSLSGNVDWSHPPAELVLVTVHFGYDQYSIQSADRALLAEAEKKLAADPTIHVVAVGHCDWHGSEQYNLALGEKRSNSVKSYLAKIGASAAAIDTLSFGAYGATPDVGKESPEAKNDRRVDLVKVPAGTALPSGPPSATPTKAAGEGS